MSTLQNDTLLRALQRQPTPYTPIWLMRQAGRYLPEYNQTREKAGSFLALARNPELATEVTLQPLARYPLDAAIVFSDILTVPDAMGLGLDFVEGEGPRFAKPVQSEADVAALKAPEPGRLQYVFDAVREVRRALGGRVPLIGFAGSPWTLACYMVEGQAPDDFRTVKSLLYRRPDLLHRILAVNAQAVTAYLDAQIDAGAQAVMIFDTWGGVLADGAFQAFSLVYMRQVLAHIKKHHEGERIPSIAFTKGGGIWLEELSRSGADAVGVDWTVDLAGARRDVGTHCALQGNLDPMALFAGEGQIRDAARRVIDRYCAGDPGARTRHGHVFNLGHGISRFTPPESVAILVDEVHQYSRTGTGA